MTLLETPTRKRDRIHPANRRPDLPILVKTTCGDVESHLAALGALRELLSSARRSSGVVGHPQYEADQRRLHMAVAALLGEPTA